MKSTALLKLLLSIIVLMIIFGGVIIIIIHGPIPEPVCPACVARLIVPWCVAEILLGMSSLLLISRLFYSQKTVRRYRTYQW